MITIPSLQTALLDLLHEIRDSAIKPIIGGGLGIYLKTEQVRQRGARTLLREWPEPRSTNDIDLFLRPELLIQSKKLKPLAEAIARLGYQVVPGAEKYQFVKPGPGGGRAGSFKIDLLTGPQSHFEGTKVKADERRARPSPSVSIHAHPVDEAPTLEEGLVAERLDGKLSSGAPWSAEVYLPHPYTFLMMKMFAFRDRIDDANKEYGRYHALDLYTILSITTDHEWNTALELRTHYKDNRHIQEAGVLVARYFSALDQPGMLRLRESRYYRSELQLADFMSALNELFPSNDEHRGPQGL